LEDILLLTFQQLNLIIDLHGLQEVHWLQQGLD